MTDAILPSTIPPRSCGLGLPKIIVNIRKNHSLFWNAHKRTVYYDRIRLVLFIEMDKAIHWRIIRIDKLSAVTVAAIDIPL